MMGVLAVASGRSIRHLAKESGIAPGEAIRRLRLAGLPYDSPHQVISRARIHQARVAVSSSPPPEAVPAAAGDPPPESPEPAATTSDSAKRAGGGGDGGRLKRSDYPFRVIGREPSGELRHLTPPVVLDIHHQLVDDFKNSGDPIEPAGTRGQGELLESALSRPLTSLGVSLKYPTVEMASAALLCALIQDHPFHNGNKRTAIVACLVFLDSNGYLLTAGEEDLFQYVLDLAGHATVEATEATADTDAEVVNAAEWIARNSRKLNTSQRRTKWRELRAILERHDCKTERLSGNRIRIDREGLVAYAGARNDGADMDKGTISRIRSTLHLDEEHGVDSDSFYYRADRVHGFINKYRKTLARLAKY